jgi:hypothetical protein
MAASLVAKLAALGDLEIEKDDEVEGRGGKLRM